jgi:hypothetical protein
MGSKEDGDEPCVKATWWVNVAVQHTIIIQTVMLLHDPIQTCRTSSS